uniref:hypothetical protein n=1 Tax=Polypodium hydriforme TaxID=43186 RepID=UPI0021155884
MRLIFYLYWGLFILIGLSLGMMALLSMGEVSKSFFLVPLKKEQGKRSLPYFAGFVWVFFIIFINYILGLKLVAPYYRSLLEAKSFGNDGVIQRRFFELCWKFFLGVLWLIWVFVLYLFLYFSFIFFGWPFYFIWETVQNRKKERPNLMGVGGNSYYPMFDNYLLKIRDLHKKKVNVPHVFVLFILWEYSYIPFFDLDPVVNHWRWEDTIKCCCICDEGFFGEFFLIAFWCGYILLWLFLFVFFIW